MKEQLIACFNPSPLLVPGCFLPSMDSRPDLQEHLGTQGMRPLAGALGPS